MRAVANEPAVKHPDALPIRRQITAHICTLLTKDEAGEDAVDGDP